MTTHRIQWRLRVASRDVVVIPRHELRASDGPVIPPRLLQAEYARWLADPARSLLVRDMVERFRGPGLYARVALRSLDGRSRARSVLARLFSDGVLVALAVRPESAGAPPIHVEDTAPPPPAPPDASDTKTWISILLVDTAGEPVRNHRYRMTLPDGGVREGTTNARGAAYFADIDPGQCTFELPGTEGADWTHA